MRHDADLDELGRQYGAPAWMPAMQDLLLTTPRHHEGAAVARRRQALVALSCAAGAVRGSRDEEPEIQEDARAFYAAALRAVRAVCGVIRAEAAAIFAVTLWRANRVAMLAARLRAWKVTALCAARRAADALAGKLHHLVHICLTAARLAEGRAVAPPGATG